MGSKWTIWGAHPYPIQSGPVTDLLQAKQYMPIFSIDELPPSHVALDETFRQEALFCSKLTKRRQGM
jgi:hypothetical protein